MRATIHDYIDAAKARKEEETGEEGFSLIELIIVVVIIAILAAIAVPIFLGIQQNAKNSALQGIAGNGAAAVAGAIANNTTIAGGGAGVPTAVFNPDATSVTVTVSKPASGNATLDNYCVTAKAVAGGSFDGGVAATSGPGC